MNNLFTFCLANPGAAIVAVIAALVVIGMTYNFVANILALLFRSYLRTMRTLTLYKHGYPPAHCDADGDQTEKVVTPTILEE